MTNRTGESMSVFRRLLAGAAACIMLVAMSGCGTGGKDESSGSQPASSKGDSIPQDGSSQISPPTDVDLDGYVFQVASLWPTIVWPAAGYNTYGDEVLGERYANLEAQGVTIDMNILDPNYAMEQIRAELMSGNKFADFIQLDYSRYMELIRTGYVQPLDGLVDVNADVFFKQNVAAATYKGKHYGVEFLPPMGSGIICIYNRTLVEEQHHLPSVSDLALNGEWTWEKFVEYMSAVQSSSIGGDGTPNVYGFGTIDWGANNFEKPFIFSNNSSVAVEGPDGKYKNNLNSDNAIEALNFLRRITVDLKLSHPENGAQGDSYQHVRAFKEGKVAFIFGSDELFYELSTTMTDEWGIAPVPKGPKAENYAAMDNSLLNWVMPTTNDHAKEAAACLYYISQPVNGTAQEDLDVYYDELRYNYFTSDKDWEVLQMIWDYRTWDVTRAAGDMDELSEALYACTRENDTTPSAAMQSVAGVVQTQIDEYLNKDRIQPVG